MGLKNDGTKLFDYKGDMIIPSTVAFAKAESRLANKKSVIEDLQNEYALLERQAFDTYKNHVNYWGLDAELLLNVRDWLNMQKSGKDKDGNKLDGRKHYKEKDIYKYVVNTLKGYLGIKDFVITGFLDFNFGQAHELIFTSNGHKWKLTIPNLLGIKLNHYQNYGASAFKIELRHCDSEHITSFVGSTFVEEELKDIMANGLTKIKEQKNEV